MNDVFFEQKKGRDFTNTEWTFAKSLEETII